VVVVDESVVNEHELLHILFDNFEICIYQRYTFGYVFLHGNVVIVLKAATSAFEKEYPSRYDLVKRKLLRSIKFNSVGVDILKL